MSFNLKWYQIEWLDLNAIEWFFVLLISIAIVVVFKYVTRRKKKVDVQEVQSLV